MIGTQPVLRIRRKQARRQINRLGSYGSHHWLVSAISASRAIMISARRTDQREERKVHAWAFMTTNARVQRGVEQIDNQITDHKTTTIISVKHWITG